MPKALLISRPNHDLTTNYLYFWSKPIIDEARIKGVGLMDLEGKKAIRNKMESYLKARKPSFVFFNGHGNQDVITGNDNEPLVSFGINEKLFSGLIIYARSCEAGTNLGPSLVKNGAKAFIGYKKKFVFVSSSNHTTTPLKDPYAKFFLEPSNLVPTSLLKGNTIEEAFNKSQKAMGRNLQYLISSAASTDEQPLARWVFNNIKGQSFCGDPTAKI